MTGPATICQGLLLLINQGNTNYSTSYSFVDLDMFMWFLGIVIGHCGQHVSVELNPDEPLDFQIDVDANSTMTQKVLRLTRTFRLRIQ